MKNSKLYFILSMVINGLFVASALILFFNPSNIVFSPGGGWISNAFNGYLGWTLLFAPLILLSIVILFFFWGIWLVGISKIRNKMVIIGLIACLVSFSVTAVLVQNRLESTKCPFEKGESGWPCGITNPL